jgi:hypothetical protein
MDLLAAVLSTGLAFQGGTEIAVGGGTRGPWQQNDSRYDYVDDPAVAIDPQGRVTVAWVDQRHKDVFLRASSGGTVNVSRSPETFSWLPKLTIDPRSPQVFHLLWQEIIFSGGSHGGEILYARSTDGGRTFSAPRNLSKSVAGDGKGRSTPQRWHNGSLDIAAGADGAVEAPARAPSLSVGPDRALVLAWTDGEVRTPAPSLRSMWTGARASTLPGSAQAGSGSRFRATAARPSRCRARCQAPRTAPTAACRESSWTSSR